MEGGGRNGRERAQAVSLSRVVCPWVCKGDGGKLLLRITQESLAELKRFDHSTTLCVRLPQSYLIVSAIDTYVQLHTFLHENGRHPQHFKARQRSCMPQQPFFHLFAVRVPQQRTRLSKNRGGRAPVFSKEMHWHRWFRCTGTTSGSASRSCCSWR